MNNSVSFSDIMPLFYFIFYAIIKVSTGYLVFDHFSLFDAKSNKNI